MSLSIQRHSYAANNLQVAPNIKTIHLKKTNSLKSDLSHILTVGKEVVMAGMCKGGPYASY